MIKPVLLLVLLVVCAPLPLAAQENGDALFPAPLATAAAAAAPAPATHRPAALIPLYISFGALQAADIHSTLRALDAGGREANPFLGGVAGSPGALIAVKTAGTAATIFAVERLSKKHPITAVVTMVAINSFIATLAAHNYAIAGRP
jgi:hypothetical protein